MSAAFSAPSVSVGETPGLVEQAWRAIGLGGRLALIALVAVLVIWGVVVGLRRLGKAGRRALLLGLTVLFLVAFLGLGGFALRLPASEGTYFVLWHQVVRVGAVLSATAFVVAFMSLAIPWLLDRFEGRGFVPFVAVRHVRATKSGFLTAMSILSIAGVAVSAFALVVVVSIMGGFGADLKRKILGNNAHVRVDSGVVGGFDGWEEVLRDVRVLPAVRAATPVAAGEAMASSASNTAGLLLRGVDADTIGTTIDLIDNIQVGDFDYLVHPGRLHELGPDEPIGIGPGGQRYLKGPERRAWLSDEIDKEVAEVVAPPLVEPGIIIGRELAKSLHVYVGDELTLVAPLGDLGPMGVIPRTRRFRVAAIFYSGMYEYDANYAYALMEEVQGFLDMTGKVSSVDIKVRDAERVEEALAAVTEAVARDDVALRVRSWKELNKNLFSALELERIATFIVLSLAIAVASFCIICTLLLMVTEKSKEIAILKAAGASDGAILRVFMLEGLITGGIGTLFGVVTGYISCFGLQRFGLRLDPEVYYIDRLPITVEVTDYVLVAISAMLITMGATIYPALAASRLRPVDGIRYE